MTTFNNILSSFNSYFPIAETVAPIGEPSYNCISRESFDTVIQCLTGFTLDKVIVMDDEAKVSILASLVEWASYASNADREGIKAYILNSPLNDAINEIAPLVPMLNDDVTVMDEIATLMHNKGKLLGCAFTVKQVVKGGLWFIYVNGEMV